MLIFTTFWSNQTKKNPIIINLNYRTYTKDELLFNISKQAEVYETRKCYIILHTL